MASNMEEELDDHKRFLDLYEAPTKLYRMLSSRPAVYLRRNLAYLQRKKKRNQIVPSVDGQREEEFANTIRSESWLEMMVDGVDDIGPMYPPAVGRAIPGVMELNVYLVKSDFVKEEDQELELLGSCTFSETSQGKISILATRFFEYNVSSLIFKVTSQHSSSDVPLAPSSTQPRAKRSASSHHKRQKRRKTQSTSSGAVTSEEGYTHLEDSYVANLVVYDSRHHCLVESGDCQLLLHKEGCVSVVGGNRSTMNWKTVFGMTDERVSSEETTVTNKVLKVKFTWIGGSPQNGYLCNMDAQLSSIRAEYDNKFPKLRRRDAPKPTLVSDSQNGENNTIVVYDFTYGNNQYQQTEVKQSLLCPWCVCRCRFKAIHPLLLHLKLDHSVFTFSYMPLDGGYKIEVRANDSDKCTQSNLDRVFLKDHPVKRQQITELITWKGNSPTRSSTVEEFLPQNCLSVYDLRQFYHTHTCMPILEGEYDSDSEAEDSPEWLKVKMMQMIEEFSDVSDSDKKLMKLWNLHTLDNRIISFKQVADECKTFVSANRSLLASDRELQVSFKCHLAHLQERGIINGTQIIEIVALLHSHE